MPVQTAEPQNRYAECVVRDALSNGFFGTVSRAVQDGRVIRVDKNGI